MSPIVGLHADPGGEAAATLAAIAAGASGPAVADIVDGDETHHRMWAVPVLAVGPSSEEVAPGVDEATAAETGSPDAEGGSTAVATAPRSLVDELVAVASAGPITIADGHHRYETALRYRDERRMSRSREEDPAFDYVLALLLATSGEERTVPRPTGSSTASADGVEAFVAGLGSCSTIGRSSGATRSRPTSAPRRRRSTPRGGVAVRAVDPRRRGHLTARRASFDGALPAGGDALRRLDVTLLQAALPAWPASTMPPRPPGGSLHEVGRRGARRGRPRASGGPISRSSSRRRRSTTSSPSLATATSCPRSRRTSIPSRSSGLVINPHEW
jgi:hypothetical protein